MEAEVEFSVLIPLLTLIQRGKYDYILNKRKGKGNSVLIPFSQYTYISNNSTYITRD